MKSITSVYKIGNGPSSSHTVGPYRAALLMGERYPEATAWQVTLYGSLAFTGEGHGTEKAIRTALPGAEILFDPDAKELPHPNTMRFRAFRNGKELTDQRIFSVGGGSIPSKTRNPTRTGRSIPRRILRRSWTSAGRRRSVSSSSSTSWKGQAWGSISARSGKPCRRRWNGASRRRASCPAG